MAWADNVILIYYLLFGPSVYIFIYALYLVCWDEIGQRPCSEYPPPPSPLTPAHHLTPYLWYEASGESTKSDIRLGDIWYYFTVGLYCVNAWLLLYLYVYTDHLNMIYDQITVPALMLWLRFYHALLPISQLGLAIGDILCILSCLIQHQR